MGQWLVLSLHGIPTFGFKVGSLEIIVKYTSSNITTWLEVLVVAIGQLTNVAVLAVATFFAFLLSKAAGRTPVMFSKVR